MPTASFDPPELARRKKAVEECLKDGFRPLGRHILGSKGSAIAEAARRLGIAQTSLHHTVSSGRIKPDWSLFKPPPTPPVTSHRAHLEALPPEERREVVQLRDEVKYLKAQIKEIERENISAETVRKHIFGLSEHTPAPPAWLVAPPKSTSGMTGVPSTIWSDWHVGEVVSLSETNGINEFNMEIAERRIKALVMSTLDLAFSHMTSPRYPGIVVNLLGDIISGGIHPELAENDEEELFPTILWTVDRLVWALTTLADKFGKVFVPCSPGNHGRVFDKKPRMKFYAHRNADWLIANLLERHFKAAKDARVQFAIPASGDVLYSVYGHRYMTTHGDALGVRGGDGIIGMLGPVARGEIKMRNSSAQIGRDYDTLLMGHWHSLTWLPRAIVNGALKGFDEYALRALRATPAPPSQALWFTHPRWGITCRWEVLLEKGPSSAGKPWLSWKDAAA